MAEILVGKVRPDLTNNLTQTVTGNALDAVQGKVLDDKITTQGQQIGILDDKSLTQRPMASDLDNEIIGTSRFNNPNHSPISYGRVATFTSDDGYYPAQIVFDADAMFFRGSLSDSLVGRQFHKVATTEKTEILPSMLKNNWVFTNAGFKNIRVIGNTAFVNVEIGKGIRAVNTIIMELPILPKNPFYGGAYIASTGVVIPLSVEANGSVYLAGTTSSEYMNISFEYEVR